MVLQFGTQLTVSTFHSSCLFAESQGYNTYFFAGGGGFKSDFKPSSKQIFFFGVSATHKILDTNTI